ncbi:hypothetical protein XENOCAPTIV_015480, partial [Xenoophorus captivus]
LSFALTHAFRPSLTNFPLSFFGSKVSELEFAEYNGFEDKNGYTSSPNVTKRIAAELAKPFMFEHVNGHIDAIRAYAEVSTAVVNIVRGILDFFQVTVKTTQNIYDLEEVQYYEINCSVSHMTGKNVTDVTDFYFVCRLESMASVRVTMLLKKMREQMIGPSLRLWTQTRALHFHQPLLDMATEALRSDNKEEMVVALKALGNAGHPGSMKTIMRYLPGVAATPVDLPLRDVTLTMFLQKDLPSEVRMLAFRILFDTKPSMALVSTVTAHLLEERDLQVASFAYSYLKGFANSETPDNHWL